MTSVAQNTVHQRTETDDTVGQPTSVHITRQDDRNDTGNDLYPTYRRRKRGVSVYWV